MKKLNELVSKIDSIANGEGNGILCSSLKDFFSDADVKERIIEANQNQLYLEEVGRNGRILGSYTNRVAHRKYKAGLPYLNYTFYNTGDFFKTMNVVVADDGFAVVQDPNGMGIDVINNGVRGVHNQAGIEWMFKRYDPQMFSLGLTDENFSKFVKETDMKGRIVKRLKKYLHG